MPKGPRGEMPPSDAIGLAVMIDKISTGEIEDEVAATKSARSALLRPNRQAERFSLSLTWL
jgi:hypothetical protein